MRLSAQPMPLAVITAMVLLASGCVRTWTPVDDATRISDDRIKVARPDGNDEELEHARACGPTLIGVPAKKDRACDCAVSCRIFDITREQISVLRTDRRPVSDYLALAFSVVGTVVLLSVAAVVLAQGAGGS